MKARAKPRIRARRTARPPMQIDPAGDWRPCTTTIPKDCDVLNQTKARLALDAIARRGQSPAVEMIATATWRQRGDAS